MRPMMIRPKVGTRVVVKYVADGETPADARNPRFAWRFGSRGITVDDWDPNYDTVMVEFTNLHREDVFLARLAVDSDLMCPTHLCRAAELL